MGLGPIVFRFGLFKTVGLIGPTVGIGFVFFGSGSVGFRFQFELRGFSEFAIIFSITTQSSAIGSIQLIQCPVFL